MPEISYRRIAVKQHFEKNFFYNRKLIQTPVIQGKKVPNRACSKHDTERHCQVRASIIKINALVHECKYRLKKLSPTELSGMTRSTNDIILFFSKIELYFYFLSLLNQYFNF